jgi:hypothetical protein
MTLDRIGKDWMFPLELTSRSFQASNGEFGWTREDARLAVSIVVQQQHAILGGELWWVSDGARDWTGLIPQRHGSDAVYPWETKRAAGEEWAAFVARCAHETLQAIERWPGIDDLPANPRGRILYNLTWVSETEYRDLVGDAV